MTAIHDRQRPCQPAHGWHNTFWSERRVKTLCELWAIGMSARMIGERVGATKNAVIGKAHRLGLVHPVTRSRAIARAWRAEWPA